MPIFGERHQPSPMTVHGVVSVRESRVEVRFRHHTALALEEATNKFVQDAWAGPFDPFEDREKVPIREPLSTDNIYLGTIRTPRGFWPRLKETVRHHSHEFIVLLLSVALCATTVVLSRSILHQIENPGLAKDALAELQWWQGWFDRLATAGLITGLYSFIELVYHFARIYKICIINWDSE